MTSISRRDFLRASVAAGAGLALPLRVRGAPDGERPEASTTHVYQLEVVVEEARAELRLNGFPLGELSAGMKTAATTSLPVNPYLCGARNAVEISLAPRPRQPSLAGAALRVSVRRLEKGAAVEPGAGEEVTRYALPADVAAQRRAHPAQLTHRFATEGPDFSAELLDAKPFADEAALRDYAMKLRAQLASKDVNALVAELEPKARAYGAAYGEPSTRFAERFGTELHELVVAGADLSFGKDDLVLRPWCGGRIWELARRGGAALLRTRPSAVEETALPVFAAPREGTLRIVR